MCKRVVIIDQCASTRQLACQVLEGAGFSVATADCCVYANDLIYGAFRPDLIILDVRQPRMRGERKVQLLKAREKSREIPILLTAALAEAELCGLAGAAGADGYLVKPFAAATLLAEVARHLAC